MPSLNSNASDLNKTLSTRRFDSVDEQSTDTLREFVTTHSPLFVLTGAGCSTDSGLGDYRDQQGQWKRNPPITAQTFLGDEAARKRYWARSFVGWPSFSSALPNKSHKALAKLQTRNLFKQLITQNVDGLHQKAGHSEVIDLHGSLDKVICMGCKRRFDRQEFQNSLSELNPTLQHLSADMAPDGDADIEQVSFDWMVIPGCKLCGEVLKPDVVFFGENVPTQIVGDAMTALSKSRALLVVGSSLMVYSGFRFARRAHALDLPIASINLGVTRADELLALKFDTDCASMLSTIV